MGLGKTLQVASFVDIFLRYTTAKKVLCIVPINTIQNWLAEFNMWLPSKPDLITDSNGIVVEASDSSTVRYRDFQVYLLSDNHKTTMARAKVIGKQYQMDLFYVQVSKQVSLLIGLHFFDVAVEPVLSGHPQGMAK